MSGFLPGLLLILLMAALQLLPQAAQELLRYERAGVDAGEWWRLLGGNFLHLGWGHYWLNAAGLVFVMAIFADDWQSSDWFAQLAVCSVAVTLGVHFFSPEIVWCVGLSGVLHGLFVYGAVLLAWRREPLAWWMLLGVIAKLVWEQVVGELPMTADISGGRVVVDAHLWGAISGLTVALAVGTWRRTRARV